MNERFILSRKLKIIRGSHCSVEYKNFLCKLSWSLPQTDGKGLIFMVGRWGTTCRQSVVLWWWRRPCDYTAITQNLGVGRRAASMPIKGGVKSLRQMSLCNLKWIGEPAYAENAAGTQYPEHFKEISEVKDYLPQLLFNLDEIGLKFRNEVEAVVEL
jgi:hypothetical protein